MSMWVHSQIHPLFCQIEFKTPRWQQQKHSTGFFQTSREACQCFLLSMDRTEFRSISRCLTQIFCFLSVSVLPLFLFIIKAAKDIGASKSSEKHKQLEQTAEIWQLPSANDWFANGSCSVLRPCEYWGLKLFYIFSFTTQLGHIEISEITVIS